MSNSTILPINRNLSNATTPGQSGPGNDSNERVLRILQSSRITWTSPPDCLVSYPRHSLGESYPSAGMQSMYSAAPADLAIRYYIIFRYYISFKRMRNNTNETTTIREKWKTDFIIC